MIDDIKKINKITWLPWIGENYRDIMVIGESHYEDGDEWQLNNPETSKIIIQKRLNGIEGNWKLHRNVERIILNKENIENVDVKKVWESVSYWNLVQRLLDSRKSSDRPNDEDFDTGWEVFFELIKILKPKYCLVLGKSSYGRFGNYLTNVDKSWNIIKSERYPNEKVLKIQKNNSIINFVFINHPSGSFGFNYEKWAEIVLNEFK